MIGILDSGLGGLSVLREIHYLLPHATLSYFGDSAWCPYGTKSFTEIQERVTSIVDLLLSEGAEIIVIACNSATIACVEYLRAHYPVPIVGMEPGVKPAAQITKTGKIGVFATEASLAGQKFHRLLSAHAQGIEVITQPCPDFVTLVESGHINGPAVDAAIRKYAEQMITAGIDTLVLGCTHYPFLKPAIRNLYPTLHIIDTGAAVARQVARKTGLPLSPSSAHLPQPTGDLTFRTSGSTQEATSLLRTLCPLLTDSSFTQLNL